MKHIYFSIIFMLIAATHASAFVVDDIEYEATSNSTAKVVATWPNYMGDITIPSKITHSGKTYTVDEIDRLAFHNAQFLTGITLPATITTIGDNAFAGCTAIQRIVIPDNVTTIGPRAFSGCSSLTEVVLGNKLTSIDVFLFYQCSQLKSVTIPKSVHSIGTMAFSFTAIEKINIDKNVTDLALDAFEDCPSLKRIDIDDLEAWCQRDFTSPTHNPLYFARNLYVNGNLLSTITIPKSISTIKPYTFINCTANEVEFHDGIHTIDLSAFISCKRISTVLIPNNVTRLISDKLNSSDAVFDYATKLTVGSGIKEIPINAFDYCTAMSTIILQEGLEVINYSGFSYNGCRNIVLPSTLKKLASSFFACNKLQSITLNKGLKEMVGGVLANCNSLREIHSRITDPYQVDFYASDHFSGINSCTLYVPKGTLEKYRTHPYWKKLLDTPSNSIQEEPGFVTDVNRDGHTDVEDVNLVINFILRLDYPGANLTACDVNCDERVDVEDVNAIVNTILKIFD